MNEEKLIPDLRFSEYQDIWEQKKLADYLVVSAEKNTNNLYNKKDVLSVSGEYGVVNQIKFQGRSFAGVSVSNYGVVYTGDVVYTKSPLKANPYGIIKTNNEKNGIVSVLYGVFHPKENINPYFIQTYFEQDTRLNNYLRTLVNKGAKNTLLISDEESLQGLVRFAPTYEEQSKIQLFFENINNLIAFNKKEYDKLIIIKKSMLEKMFPQNGMNVPEVRFNGFTDPWEQRKLGDLYTERNERGYDTLKILSVSIHHGVSNEELDSDTLGKKVRRSKDKTLYKHVYQGDLVLNMMRAWQGAIGVVKSEGMVSPAYITAMPNAQLYPLFMDYNLRRYESISQMNYLSYGVTDFRKRLYWDSFIKILCYIPSVPEQEKITTFFSNLDRLITIHQCKIEKLRNIKAGCLEKMFV